MFNLVIGSIHSYLEVESDSFWKKRLLDPNYDFRPGVFLAGASGFAFQPILFLKNVSGLASAGWERTS